MLKTYRAALKILLYIYIYYSTDALVESGNWEFHALIFISNQSISIHLELMLCHKSHEFTSSKYSSKHLCLPLPPKRGFLLLIDYLTRVISFPWLSGQWVQFPPRGPVPCTGGWSVGWNATLSQGMVDTIGRWNNGPAFADEHSLLVSWCMYGGSWWCHFGPLQLWCAHHVDIILIIGTQECVKIRIY